jgi:murein hydrolase activator
MIKKSFVKLLFCVFLICCASLFAETKTASEGGSSLSASKLNLEKIKINIKEKESKIKEVKEEEEKIKKNLESIKNDIELTENTIKDIKNNISKTKQDYNKNQNKLDEQQKKLDALKDRLANELIILFKKQLENRDSQDSFLYDLVFAQTLSDKDREYYNFKIIFNNQNVKHSQIVSKQEDIKFVLDRINKNKKQLEVKHSNYTAKKKTLAKSEEKNTAKLSDAESKRQKYEKELEQLKQSAKDLQSLINKILSKSTAVKTRGETDEYLKIIRERGFISKPVNGKILTKFGKNKHPDLDTFVISNGVEISATRGEDVKAVYKGKVVFSGDFKSYGNMLILDNGGNVYTVYAYLSNINFVKGQDVVKGSILGKAGYSSMNKQYAVYFEVRLQGVPMDPVLWFGA